MWKRILFVSFAVFALVVFSATLSADVIVLKSGRTIEGDIVEETEDLVAVQLDTGGTGFFSKDDIQSINKTKLGVARGQIMEVTGTVEVLVKGETEWKPAEKGTPLDEGYTIRSGPDSKAVAVFADKAIMAIEQDSKVNLERLQKSRRVGINIKVNLDQGQIWNDVGKLTSKRSKFYVETTQAVTGVRGTVFTVQVFPDATTRVGVVKGTVDVRTRGMAMSPTKVGENSMTEVAVDKAPTAPTTISEEYTAQWNQYKAQFQRIRLQMAAGGLGDLPTPVLLAVVGVAIVIIVFILSRVLKRRNA